MPPPAEASTVSCASSSCAFVICSCICWTCFSIWFMSIPIGSALLDLARVEGVLEQRDEVFLGLGDLLLDLLGGLPQREGDAEAASGQLVEGVLEERRVLRVLGLL